MIYTTSVKLREMECGGCGAVFAMSETFYKECQNKGTEWHCPRGCSRVFCETKNSKLQEQLRREKLERESAESSKDRAWEEADKAIRIQRAYKGHLTRTKNRLAAGLCPCCNRNFENVGRHIRSQHPGYSAKEATK